MRGATPLPRSKRGTDVRRNLLRAIALNREFPAPFVDLAVLFLNTGRTDWALGRFEAALNLPDTAGSFPDPNVPISALPAELQCNSSNPTSQDVLARLLGKSGADPQQVAKAFREAILLRPDHPETPNHVGLLRARTDQTDKAIDASRKAIRLRPTTGRPEPNLGGLLVDQRGSRTGPDLELKPAKRIGPWPRRVASRYERPASSAANSCRPIAVTS